MAERDPMQPSDSDIATAGEYVLGTLPQPERQEFARRLETDEALQHQVRLWQTQFSPLTDEVTAVPVPQHVWAGLQARLFSDTATPGQTGVPRFWRWLGIGSALVAASLLAVVLLDPLSTVGPQAPADERLWVSDMVSQDGEIRLAALYDEDKGEMRVSVGGQAPGEGRDWELWLIKDELAPISLGVMPRQGTAAMPIPDELRALVADATLAITDEPAGGSPQGVATGPVVAAAQLRRI